MCHACSPVRTQGGETNGQIAHHHTACILRQHGRTGRRLGRPHEQRRPGHRPGAQQELTVTAGHWSPDRSSSRHHPSGEVEAIEGVLDAEARIVKLGLLDLPDRVEPGTMLLAGLGLLVIARMRR